MSVDESQKNIVQFTQAEIELNIKTANQIKVNFMKHHPEIIAPGNSDLTKMIREEKQMYSNLAIDFAVNVVAAMEKKKRN